MSYASESNRVTLGELESHLWESANILRGPVDQADFKSYVFPLLFLKRISDAFASELIYCRMEAASELGEVLGGSHATT